MNKFRTWLLSELDNYDFITNNRYDYNDFISKDYIKSKTKKINKSKEMCRLYAMIFIGFALTTFAAYLNGIFNQPSVFLLLPVLCLFSFVFLFVEAINLQDSKSDLKKYILNFRQGLKFNGKNKRVENAISFVKNNIEMKKALLEYGKYYENNPNEKRSRSEKLFYSELFYFAFEKERESEKTSLKKYLTLKLRNEIMVVN